jgi:hypothetical protein
VKLLVLALCFLGFAFAADETEGNFTIRFEPTAKLQANVEVPFEVHVTDDRKRPLQQDDSVELSIGQPDEAPVKTMKAWFVQAGVFIAKPTFPSDGKWDVTIVARRANQISRRTISFSVVP